jgi:hypothetical protein
MKPRPLAELSPRTIRAYVREKLRGFTQRQRERERIRKGERPRTAEQERLFE